MYPIKNMFTGKEIGKFGVKDGRLQIEGDFPQKAAMLDLASHASAIRGEMFEGGIRDEQVPLDPTKDLDRVANFVNGNLADHSIRIINYTEEEEMPDEDLEDMVKVQSHTREGGKVHVDEYERREPGTGDKEEVVGEKTLYYVCKECDKHFKQVKGTPTCPQCRSTNIVPVKRKTKESPEAETPKSPKREYSAQEWQEGTFDADKALQECVSTKIPIFKKEHPDWTDEHVQAAAYGYCKEHLGKSETKDSAFALIKDNDFAGIGTVFQDGTVVLHTKDSTELYGTVEKLTSIHSGEIILTDIAAGVKKTTHEEGHRVDYTENYRRERQFEPSECKEQTERTFEKNGKKMVGCVRKSSGKFEVQSILTETKDQAFTDCPRRKSLLEDSALVGYTTPLGYLDHTAEITQSHAIKGITVADVILAREMIQDYHVSELPPWIRDQIGDKEFVRVLKPYEELEQTFSGMKELPTTQFHVEDSFPSMDSPVVLSVVKNIRADPKCRCIRGKIYFVEKNWPTAVMDSVKRGEITAVSIGGSTEFGPGGTFNGQIYDLKQVHIKGGHLAVLPGAEGRCPRGLCGVNLKDAKNRYVGTSNESNRDHVQGHFNTLELTVPTFSQAIFQIDDSLKSVIDIKEPDQNEGNTLVIEESNTMANEEIVQKLQDALAAKNQELLKITTELNTFKDSATAKKLKEMEVESTAVKDQFAALQKENAKLKDDAAKLEVRVKEADTFRHSMYDRALLSTPFYKGKEKELAAMPLDEKAIVFRTAQNLGAVQLADAAILADGFPKPSEAQRQQFMDSGGKSRPKMPDPAVTVPKEGAK